MLRLAWKAIGREERAVFMAHARAKFTGEVGAGTASRTELAGMPERGEAAGSSDAEGSECSPPRGRGGDRSCHRPCTTGEVALPSLLVLAFGIVLMIAVADAPRYRRSQEP